MAWVSNYLVQTPNAGSREYAIAPQPGTTKKDIVVVGPESGGPYIEIERIRVRADRVYRITTRATSTSGTGTVVFRFWGEEIVPELS